MSDGGKESKWLNVNKESAQAIIEKLKKEFNL